MITITCPCCKKIITIRNEDSYYSRHRERILKQYHEQKDNPEFKAHRREIALKSYHKRRAENYGKRTES